jgi:hypothetical protein
MLWHPNHLGKAIDGAGAECSGLIQTVDWEKARPNGEHRVFGAARAMKRPSTKYQYKANSGDANV